MIKWFSLCLHLYVNEWHYTISHREWGLCEYVIVHTILGGSPVILWISLGGKPRWLPLKFGYRDIMRTSPISSVEYGGHVQVSLACHLRSER